MNWEAVVVAGAAVALLAVLLLVPGLISAKRLARRDPRFNARVTRGGMLFFSSQILLLLIGLALLPGLLRDTWIERMVGAGVPIVLYIVFVMLAYFIVGRALERRGFRAVIRGIPSRGADS